MVGIYIIIAADEPELATMRWELEPSINTYAAASFPNNALMLPTKKLNF